MVGSACRSWRAPILAPPDVRERAPSVQTPRPMGTAAPTIDRPALIAGRRVSDAVRRPQPARARTTPCDIRLNPPRPRRERRCSCAHGRRRARAVLGFPADRIDDIRLAVTEACTNVVRHAYAAVRAARRRRAPRPTRLTVIVTDQAAASSRESRQRAGAARPAADGGAAAGLRDRPARRPGHAVPMSFHVRGRFQPVTDASRLPPTPRSSPRRTSRSRPGRWSGPVLRRVVGMLAARADLPLDSLDDAVLVADVVARARGPTRRTPCA